MHHTTSQRPLRRRRSGAALGALLALGLALGLVPQAASAAPAGGAHPAATATAADAAAGPSGGPTAPSVPVCSAPSPGEAACLARRRTDVTARAGVVPLVVPSGYGPTDLRAAYALPDGGSGSPVVAIVDAYDDPNAEADLAVYRQQYGLPACTTANGCFRKVDQRGGQSYPVPNASWGGEISLDLDMVSAIAPNAHILLVESDTALMTDLAAAEDTAVSQGAGYVSNSYGGSEQPAVTGLATSYDHPGVVITASSGDSGLGSSFPATAPHVTAVGGTTLTRDGASSRGFTETAWNLAGSGCSAYFTKPSFQQDTVCPKRSEADVSAVADPATGVAVYDSYQDKGWGVYGGTSAASPIIAGVYALAGPAQSGTYANSYPYAAVYGLNDVTSGSNGSCVDTVKPLCTAGPGWDGPSGLGTPSGLSAFRPKGDTGQVTGTVTDSATGKPVAGATVADGDAHAVTAADGTYTMTLPAGAQTLTATAFGYGARTQDVTVVKDTSTRQDLSLTAQPQATVSGTVTDGSSHGWPLYAKITIPGRPGAPVYTDPVTGRFSVDLPLGAAYTMKTSAVSSGYGAKDATVDLTSATGPVTQDFTLVADMDLCRAPGYAPTYTGGHEDFDGGALPPGWTLNTTKGDHGWLFDDNDTPNQTGGHGGMAIVDAVSSGNLGQEVESDLTSPAYDLTGVTDPVVGFYSDYNKEYGGEAVVQLSTDGGVTWTQVWKAGSGNGRGPALVEVSVPQAAGQSKVQLRFHYGAPSTWDFWWGVDDAFVGSRTCAAEQGGMVAGRITDKNTGAGLNRAKAAFGTATATTAATADDTVQGDGFYQLFVPTAQGTTLTASAARYSTVTSTVSVTKDSVVRADEALPAGRVEVAQPQLAATVTLGGKQAVPLTIRNTGSAPATVELAERGAAFQTDAKKAARTAQDRQATPLQRIKGHFGDLAPTKPSAVAGTGAAAPAGGAWSGIADYPYAIMDNATGVYQGKLYSFGGAAQQTIQNNGYVYDPQLGTWASIGTLPTPRDGGSGAFIDGKFYLTGGWTTGGGMNPTTDIYDPVTGAWTKAAPIPRAYAGAGTAVMGGRLYVVGGCDVQACGHTDVQVFDPATGDWSVAAAYPYPVSWTACGGISGQLYCAGGESATETYWSGERYDPHADAWTPIARMPADVWGASYAAAGGLLVVSGGVTASSTLVTNQGWAYDPVANAWQALPDSPNAVYRAGSACGLYQVGGSKGSFSTVPTAYLLSGYDQCGETQDVGWLSESPSKVTVPAGGSVTVQVTEDATAVAQPGTYTAQLVADQDTPYGTPVVGATMTVAPPKTWGRITGTVSGAGCSATLPLAGAVVEIDSGSTTSFVTTSSDGSYVAWVDKRLNPLQVTAAADNWRPATKKAKVTAGGTLQLSFTLAPLTACG